MGLPGETDTAGGHRPIGDSRRPFIGPHHISYITADSTLFAGEAAGVNIDFGGGLVYMRPATPQRFYLDVTVTSLDRPWYKRPCSQM